MRKVLLVILGWITLSTGQAQGVADIAFFADVAINAAQPEHRQRANDSLVVLIEGYLQQDTADLEALKAVQHISQQALEGSDYVLYTWQLKKSEDDYDSFGYIKESGGPLVKLLDKAQLTADLPYEVLTADRWLGALYYKVLPTTYDGQMAWLLFGYDGHSEFDRVKVCDVLRFENGQPLFGAELFKKSEGPRPDVRNRLVLSYSKDSNVTLNYNPSLDIIMHDHLINRMGRIPGQGSTWLPDGSYEGYAWDGEHWAYDEKVFEQVLQDGEYPRPSPVLEIRGEGREYKK